MSSPGQAGAGVGLDLVLGTAQLCSAYGVLRGDQEGPGAAQARAVLDLARELGVAALDTAPAYLGAEAAIGNSGTTLPVHTKIDPALDPGDSLSRSLTLLRRSSVEILYLHDSAEVLSRDSAVISMAHQLVGDRVGALGASIYEVAELDAAMGDPRIGAVQVPLNLFDRRIDERRLLEAADRGIRVYVRSVLLQGVLALSTPAVPRAVMGLQPYVENLHRVARDLGRSTLDLALGWVRGLKGVDGFVIGAQSHEDLRGVHRSLCGDPLTPAELLEVQSLAIPPRELSDPRRWKHPQA